MRYKQSKVTAIYFFCAISDDESNTSDFCFIIPIDQVGATYNM